MKYCQSAPLRRVPTVKEHRERVGFCSHESERCRSRRGFFSGVCPREHSRGLDFSYDHADRDGVALDGDALVRADPDVRYWRSRRRRRACSASSTACWRRQS